MGGTKYARIAKKLQTACRQVFGVKLLIDERQWYHKDKNIPITVYTLYQIELDGDRQIKTKLFQTYSLIQLVLYLRDLWYILNGWEVPTDNEIWEEIKKKYAREETPTEEEPSKNKAVERWRTECNRATICDELYPAWKCAGGAEGNS